jgi:hypothetical protein
MKARPAASGAEPGAIASAVEEAIRLELAAHAYERDRFRLVRPNLGGFSHLVSSRQGLFAVGPEGWKLIAHGLFFGAVTTADSIFVFESGDLARHDGFMGRIVRLDLAEARIASWRIIARDLSSACHQLDLVDGRLCLVDTFGQCIRWFAPDGSEQGIFRPLPPARRGDWENGYVHINSLLAVRNAILLVLHNGGESTGRPSELAILDDDWQLVDRRPLPGMGCHNLAVLEDGTVLTCASLTGEIVDLDGARISVSPMMTRGLSVSGEGLAVGASTFSSRVDRHRARGALHFLAADYTPVGMIEMPGAPTEIRRLGGADRGQSSQTRMVRARIP